MKKGIFSFSYETNPVEAKEVVLETALPDKLVESFDKKIACFTDIIPKELEDVANHFSKLKEDVDLDEAATERDAGQQMRIGLDQPRSNQVHSPQASAAAKPKVNTTVRTIKVQHPEGHIVGAPILVTGDKVKDLQTMGGAKQRAAAIGGKVLVSHFEYDSDDNLVEISEAWDDLEDAPVSKFNQKTDGKYNPNKGLIKGGRIVKGKGNFDTSTGDKVDTELASKKEFKVPSVWGLEPKNTPDTSAAKTISFNDKSNKETEATANANHGPNINQERLQIALVAGKGYSVVDSTGKIITSKLGKELAGYTKRGSAAVAMRDHQRSLGEENAMSSTTFSYGDLAEILEEDITTSPLHTEWSVEVIEEGNMHRFIILDNDDVIAEGKNLSFQATAKSAYRKCLQMEEHIMSKVTQPTRVLDITKSLFNK